MRGVVTDILKECTAGNCAMQSHLGGSLVNDGFEASHHGVVRVGGEGTGRLCLGSTALPKEATLSCVRQQRSLRGGRTPTLDPDRQGGLSTAFCNRCIGVSPPRHTLISQRQARRHGAFQTPSLASPRRYAQRTAHGIDVPFGEACPRRTKTCADTPPLSSSTAGAKPAHAVPLVLTFVVTILAPYAW